MEHDFLGLPAENFREQRNIWKSSPVFADGIFQKEICVPFLQSHLWYQFQALPAVFGYMELICTNGKRDSRTKFASPELCEPFTNTTNRPVCQNKTWGNWSPAHISRAFHLCVIPTMWEPGTGYLIWLTQIFLKAEISVGTSDGTDHHGLVRPEYSEPALKVVYFDRSGHFVRTDRNVPFHNSTKLLSSAQLFCILLTKTITKW